MPDDTASSPPTDAEQAAYDALQLYTLSLGDRAFIHQHVVDAWMAQHADSSTKPIAMAFSLLGLYLHLERGFTGKQVQHVHVALGRYKQVWPTFVLPQGRGNMTAADVMRTPEGTARAQAIDAWCAAVWEAYHESRQQIIDLLARHGVLGDDPRGPS